MPTALLGTASVGLGTALGTTPGPHSAPSLNTPGQIDPSSIERAYAALGLTYQGNQGPSQTTQQTPRALNTLGKARALTVFTPSLFEVCTTV